MLSDLMPFTLCMNAMHEYTLPDFNIFLTMKSCLFDFKPFNDETILLTSLITNSSEKKNAHRLCPAILNYSDETFHVLAEFYQCSASAFSRKRICGPTLKAAER